MKSSLLKSARYLAAFGLVTCFFQLYADSLTVEGDMNVTGNLSVGPVGAPGGPGGLAKITPSAFAMGLTNVVAELGTFSVSIGENTYATGAYSLALGYEATASGPESSMAIGTNVQATGSFSWAFGSELLASGNSSLSFGNYATATAPYGHALGEYVDASAAYVTVIGRSNVIQGSFTWEESDDLFIVGNGTEDGNIRSNAFVIHKNGNTRVAGNLDVKGIVRVKPAGDLSMGIFTAGTNPAAPSTDPEPGLDAGLRYPGE